MTTKDEIIEKAELILKTNALLNKADSILEHYGTKGMRWGTRRSNKKMAKLIDQKTARQLKGLNEEQIRAVLVRMQLDKQYRDLKKASRSEGKALAVELGHIALRGAVGAAAGAVGKEMANKFMGSGKKAFAEEAAKKTLEEDLTEQSVKAALKSVKKIKNKGQKNAVNPFSHLPPPPDGGLTPNYRSALGSGSSFRLPPPPKSGFRPPPPGPGYRPPSPGSGYRPPPPSTPRGFKTENGRTFLDTSGVLVLPAPKKKS